MATVSMVLDDGPNTRSKVIGVLTDEPVDSGYLNVIPVEVPEGLLSDLTAAQSAIHKYLEDGQLPSGD